MEGGGTLVVTSALVDPYVEIVVSDSGHGIPEDIHSTIFEPFFTTKPEGTGTGLGLSTVLMIVERHQGRIELTSAAGRGTTFRIVLPAAG
jgi:signal transduction histidine kinase